jgi:hypothetical protein
MIISVADPGCLSRSRPNAYIFPSHIPDPGSRIHLALKNMGLGSGIRDLAKKPILGFRIMGSKRHRIQKSMIRNTRYGIISFQKAVSGPEGCVWTTGYCCAGVLLPLH